MTGPVAQFVALTCHGNAAIAGHVSRDFFPANSTCTFCEYVKFAALVKSMFGKSKEREIAATPQAWLAMLKTKRARGIRLSRTAANDPGISDRMSAGFVGGGGTWGMEVLLPGGESEYWRARWEVGNREDPKQRIWRVTYGGIMRAEGPPAAAVDLAATGTELQAGLLETLAFARKHEVDTFVPFFQDALDTLGSRGRNKHGYHQDLAPEGFLSGEAAMLLDACQRAWVFGGMGSWNDLYFEGDQNEYDRVSERLFQAVNAAIEAAATSRMPQV